MATARKATAVDEGPTTFNIRPMNIRRMILHIVGDSPLITSQWSEKAKAEIRDKQTKGLKTPRVNKDPEACFQAAMYRLQDGRPAIRTIGFKAAAVDAAVTQPGLHKTDVRRMFHVLGELTPVLSLDGESIEPEMREDMVRVGMGTADLRYRPEYSEWRVDLPVRYNAAQINEQQLLELFNAAGFSSGIGEWRPQRNGNHGLFHVEGFTDKGKE